MHEVTAMTSREPKTWPIPAGVPEPARSPAPESGGNTILYAEDEPVVRMLVRRLLRNAGYTVVAVADGAEALRVFRQQRDDIALVLLDVNMPRMRGDEALEAMRAEHPDVKAMFMTANVDFAAGPGTPVLCKPVMRTSLLEAVRKSLDGKVT